MHARTSSSRVAETLCANSGRERTTAFCYAVGWTQHTVGVQYIRTAAIIQLLLGNIGRPGRRHPGAARPRVDSGLDGHPDAVQPAARLPADAARRAARRPRGLRRANRRPAAGGANMRRSTSSSLLKAWWGDAATRRERVRLRLPAAHHRRPLALPRLARHARRQGEGCIVVGENPAVGSANAGSSGRRSRKLEVARRPRPRRDRDRGVLVRRARDRARRAADRGDRDRGLLLPAAAHTEKDGSFTNTQRLLQWHHKAVEPPRRLPPRALVLLPPRASGSRRSSRAPRSRATGRCIDLTWDYPTSGGDRTSRTPRRCCARSTASARDGERARRLHRS